MGTNMSEDREYKVGIVGHEAAKFTKETKKIAITAIRGILQETIDKEKRRARSVVLVSGGCHLGGIDLWAERMADWMGIRKIIFYPKVKRWEPGGFKERNIKIVETSNEVHCIVVKRYPPEYRWEKFELCYHCGTTDHIKSGGCWTAKYAQKLGKKAVWHEI